MTIVGRGLGRGGNSIVVTYGYGRGVEVAGHPICTEIWVAAAGATLAVSIATAGAAAHPCGSPCLLRRRTVLQSSRPV